MIKTIYIFLILFLSQKNVNAKMDRLCSLVDNNQSQYVSHIDDRYNNGYSRERYNEVIETFKYLFSSKVHMKGKSLKVIADWSDGAVNAWADLIGNSFVLEIPGGMSRYYLINEEAFIITICHELGHLMGGFPHRKFISFEGQADYFATMKCANILLEELKYKNIEKHLKAGVLSLGHYFSSLQRNGKIPKIETPDRSIVNNTISKHPSPQCRVDTMWRGVKCQNSEDFSFQNSIQGSCVEDELSRPKCWFTPKE